MALLPSILIDKVIGIEVHGEPSDACLLPEEALIVRGAVEKRKREFTVARTCAHRALLKLGFPLSPILQGPARQPCWPSGVVGSITHCRDYSAAAVARLKDIVAIGIDAEPHDALPVDVIDIVASLYEQRQLARLPSDGTFWDRLLFSAKECVFKACFPISQQWLDFTDATITLIPENSAFIARLNVRDALILDQETSYLEGRYLIRDDLVVAAIAVQRKSGVRF